MAAVGVMVAVAVVLDNKRCCDPEYKRKLKQSMFWSQMSHFPVAHDMSSILVRH